MVGLREGSTVKFLSVFFFFFLPFLYVAFIVLCVCLVFLFVVCVVNWFIVVGWVVLPKSTAT
jgi:hypothetical protein